MASFPTCPPALRCPPGDKSFALVGSRCFICTRQSLKQAHLVPPTPNSRSPSRGEEDKAGRTQNWRRRGWGKAGAGRRGRRQRRRKCRSRVVSSNSSHAPLVQPWPRSVTTGPTRYPVRAPRTQRSAGCRLLSAPRSGEAQQPLCATRPHPMLQLIGPEAGTGGAQPISSFLATRHTPGCSQGWLPTNRLAAPGNGE